MSIHRRIKERREALDLTMEGLADRVGVKWQTVQQWEKEGGTAPKRTRIEHVAKALLVTPEYLLYGEAKDASWPFAPWVDIERVTSLSREDLAFVAGKLDAALSDLERSAVKSTPQEQAS